MAQGYAVGLVPPPINYVINPSGDFYQRQVTASTLTAQSNNTYGPDRWKILTQTASVQSAQVAGPTTLQASQNAIRLKQNQASAQRCGMIQWVSGAPSVALRGQPVSLNFQVNISNSQAIRYYVLEWTGAIDAMGAATDVVNSWTNSTFTTGNFFKSTTMVVTGGGTVTPSAATWTSVTLNNLTVGSSCNNIAVMLFVADSTMAQNVTVDWSCVQLTPTVSAPSYVPPVKALDLCAAQHYCNAWPVNTGVFGIGFVATSSIVEFIINYPPMRAAPTMTISAASDFRANDGAAATATAVSLNNAQTNLARINITQAGTTWTVGHACEIFGANSNCFFYLDADF